MESTNQSQVSVREYKLEDKSKVEEMFRSGFQMYKEPANFTILANMFVDRTMEKDMKDIIQSYMQADKANFWVAEVDGQVAGCVGVFKHDEDQEACELVRMSVDINIRRCGIGSALIKTVEEWAVNEGFKRVRLCTGGPMAAACALYKKNGYTAET